MCVKVVEKDPGMLKSVPDQYKIQKICERTVEEKPYNLRYICNKYGNQEMCNEDV